MDGQVTQRKGLFQNARFLALILFCLLIINLFLVYFYFFVSTPTVTIVNKSPSYHLSYHPSKTFTRYLDELHKSNKTQIDGLKRIQKITITVVDQKIPSESGKRTIPEIIQPNYNLSNSNTLAVTLGIDKDLAKEFSEKELNELTSSSLTYLLYVYAYSTKPNRVKLKVSNNYNQQFSKSKTWPFSLETL